MDGRIVRCELMPISRHFRDCKALLVLSRSHVRSTIASTGLCLLPLPQIRGHRGRHRYPRLTALTQTDRQTDGKCLGSQSTKARHCLTPTHVPMTSGSDRRRTVDISQRTYTFNAAAAAQFILRCQCRMLTAIQRNTWQSHGSLSALNSASKQAPNHVLRNATVCQKIWLQI